MFLSAYLQANIYYIKLLLFILSGAVLTTAQSNLCTVEGKYLSMCNNGCSKFSLTSDKTDGVYIRDTSARLDSCALTVEAEPGYGLLVYARVFVDIGSCGSICGDDNYLRFTGGDYGECLCESDHLVSGTKMFATDENTLIIEYDRAEFVIQVIASGCPTSSLITGSRAGFAYVSGSPRTGNSYIVNVTCPEGYLLSKKYLYIENRCVIEESSLSRFGEWEKAGVKCRKVKCAAPEVPAHSRYTPYTPTERYQYGDTIVHECDSGYEIVSGQTTRKCTVEHGVGPFFSGTPPVCARKNCGVPSNIDHGNIEGADTRFNDTVRVTCYLGYRLNGSSSMRCQEDGTWSVAPTCDVVECPDPPNVPHSTYRLKATGPVGGRTKVFGSHWIYTCHSGFRLLGDSMMTCQVNGTWTSPPICTAEYCSLPNVTASTHECIDCGTNLDVRINATRRYKCVEGYMEQEQRIHCQRSGEWSDLKPCESATTRRGVDCGVPAEVPNGNWQYTNSSYADTAVLKCGQGFRLSNENLLTCNQSGHWVGGPTCVEVDCGTPMTPLNVKLREPFSTSYNSKIAYGCSEGHTLNGSKDFIKCHQSGLWSEPHECIAKDCGPPVALLIANGAHEEFQDTTYGSSIKFFCDTGYMFASVGAMVCQANGTWSSLPQCTEIDCAPPHNISSAVMMSHNGTKLRDIVIYKCNLHALELSGTCGEDGTWSYPLCPEKSTDPMMWFYIGCGVGILLVVFLVVLIVGLCFRRKEKERRINEKTRSFYGNKKMNEMSMKERTKRGNNSNNSPCSSDSGLSIGEQVGSEHHFSLNRYDYKQASSSLTVPSRMGGLEISPSPNCSNNSLSQPRSRQPIANGVRLDMMTVDEVDGELKSPLYGELRADRKGSRNMSSSLAGNSPATSIGMASPLLNNLSTREWEDNHSTRRHNTLTSNGRQGNIIDAYPSHSMDRNRYQVNPSHLRLLPGQEVGRTEECTLSIDSQEVFEPLAADKQYPVYM